MTHGHHLKRFISNMSAQDFAACVDTWERVYEQLNEGLEAARNGGSLESPVERARA
jgi:hypothetical protein